MSCWFSPDANADNKQIHTCMKRVSWLTGLGLRLPALQLAALVLQLVLCFSGFESTRFNICLLPSLCLFQGCNLFFLICILSISRVSVSNKSFQRTRTRCRFLVLSQSKHGTSVHREPAFLQEVLGTKDDIPGIRSIIFGKGNKEFRLVKAGPLDNPPKERDGSAAFNSVTVGIVELWCCRRWQNLCQSLQIAYKPI